MKFTTSDGLELAYSDEGTGTPVLCLAGLTRNMRDFDDVAPHLSDVRMIRMDYRGRAGSDRDPNYMNYAVPVEARDALELLDHLGLERAAILGTSRGGIIAMFLAAVAKDRLAGAILNDIGPDLAPEGLSKIMGYVGRNPKGKTYGEVAQALAEMNAAQFPGVSLAKWRIAAERWFEETPDGVVIRYDPKLLNAMQEAGPGGDLWPLFDALEGLPIGLIRGATSDLLTTEGAAKMREKRPDMAYGEVPARGHVPFLDEPEAVAVIRDVVGRL